jgi:hypothetical protein
MLLFLDCDYGDNSNSSDCQIMGVWDFFRPFVVLLCYFNKFVFLFEFMNSLFFLHPYPGEHQRIPPLLPPLLTVAENTWHKIPR